MAQKYNETLTELRDNVESMRSVLNEVGLDGYDNMSTWPDQMRERVKTTDTLEAEIDTLNNKIENNNEQFDNIYDAIVEKGQSPDKEDIDTYAVAIRNIETGEISLKIPNLAYFFYNNYRDLDTYWVLVTSEVYSMEKMLKYVTVDPGKEYTLDISGLNGESARQIFQGFRPNSTGSVTIKLKVTDNVTSIKKLFTYDDTNEGTWGASGRNIEFKFTDESDVSNLVDLESAFMGHTFGTIDLSKLEGVPITSLVKLFRYSAADSLIIPLNTENIEDFQYAFSYLNYNISKSLDIDLSTWIFKEGVTLLSTFLNCRANSISFKEGTIFKGCNMRSTFNGCTKLTNLKVNIQDDEDTVAESYMYTFSGCSNLVEIDSDADFTLNSTTMEYMFNNCSVLTTLPAINIYTSNTKTTLSKMFYQCFKLKEVNINIINSGQIAVDSMFYRCGELENIKGNLDLSGAINTNLFSNCTNLKTIETSGGLYTKITTSSVTLDLSASSVFDIEHFLNQLASNDTGLTRIIKLSATVYNGLTDEVKELATSKNYTLSK